MPRARAGERPAPRLRRAYFECRWGQLHVHNAIPAGGGFDEATPLLCVHDAGGTGRTFAALLPVLGRDRSVYAPDLPGTGESDPAEDSVPWIGAAAGALLDFLDGMRLRQLDVLGSGTQGIATVAALVGQRPVAFRRILLAGEADWPAGLPPAHRMAGGSASGSCPEDLLRLLG